ncbi:ComEC/Rec2 family competence protein [Vibrio parahaemolyticus]|uniref:ComEC/Rec2 family competence protein n=1 Tax=Vibrio parahaemolyticus TaxID=670 RepID=UPI001E54D05B|nr:MBL fold metallo-hydrolase [Vibrio parahaemolyticus]
MYIDILDAGHGDCLLITCGETRILVDSGPKTFKVRKELIKRLTALLAGRDIDVAIVTHNDDDHIGGYKYLLESGLIIKKFVFNSLDLIAKIVKNNSGQKKISFRQDIDLQNVLNAKGIGVQSFQNEDSPLRFNGITLTALTPNQVILERLNNRAVVFRAQKKISGSNRKETPIAECLLEIQNGRDQFVEDNSITNKSSISLILEYEEVRVLFLGDCHPSDVISALKSTEKNGSPFHAVKLSHHGSEKNTSTELLETLGETDYIICADKSHHGHPNNKTISRIIHFNKRANIHLSGNNQKLNEVFEACIEQGYPINISYPENGVNRIVYE